MKELYRKCVMCGTSTKNHPDIKLFRFPKPGFSNSLRCEMWSKYCYPDKPWAEKEFQMKLNSEHKMLCHQHFKETAFIDYPSKTLHRFAYPEVMDIPNLTTQRRTSTKYSGKDLYPGKILPTLNNGMSIEEINGRNSTMIDLQDDDHQVYDASLLQSEEHDLSNQSEATGHETFQGFKIEMLSHRNSPEVLEMDIGEGSNVLFAPGTEVIFDPSNCTFTKVSAKTNALKTFNGKVFKTFKAENCVPENSTRFKASETLICKKYGPNALGTKISLEATTWDNARPPTGMNAINTSKALNCKENSQIAFETLIGEDFGSLKAANWGHPRPSTRMNAPVASSCKKHKQIIRNLTRRIKHLKNKAYLDKLTTDVAINKLIANFSKEFQKKSMKIPKSIQARRWTQDDKIKALKLYKKSPIHYRLMRRVFDLPTPSVVLDFILERQEKYRKNKNLKMIN